jgi:protein-S-isoprenylcysteine O-methyltransferase Ste14
MKAALWLFESVLAGVLLGFGARFAMRVLAWLSGTPGGYSSGGSIEIVVFGTLLGAPLALAIFGLRQWCAWSHPWVGLWTSLVLFSALTLRPSPSAKSALAASPLAGWQILLVFGVLFAAFGLWIDVRWHRRTGRPAPIALRSSLAALLMPGMVAGVFPQLVLRGTSNEASLLAVIAGYLLVAAGLVLLVSCIVRFAHEGGGTLAPYDPPGALVVQGAYRFTRNPMYVGVLTILLGLTIANASTRLLGYTAFVAAGFYVFVHAVEEPWLESQFGESYRRYKTQVPRWLPRIGGPSGPRSE